MVASRAEMKQLSIPLHARTYCAHFLIAYEKCMEKHMFEKTDCIQERFDLERCQYEK